MAEETHDTLVYVTTSFEGFHRWAAAPKEVEFLRNWHRHKFNVRLEVNVTHTDREVEFFMLKKELEGFLFKAYEVQQFLDSCELIAHRVLDYFTAKTEHTPIRCEVNEDGENGAVVTIT